MQSFEKEPESSSTFLTGCRRECIKLKDGDSKAGLSSETTKVMFVTGNRIEIEQDAVLGHIPLVYESGVANQTQQNTCCWYADKKGNWWRMDWGNWEWWAEVKRTFEVGAEFRWEEKFWNFWLNDERGPGGSSDEKTRIPNVVKAKDEVSSNMAPLCSICFCLLWLFLDSGFLPASCQFGCCMCTLLHVWPPAWTKDFCVLDSVAQLCCLICPRVHIHHAFPLFALTRKRRLACLLPTQRRLCLRQLQSRLPALSVMTDHPARWPQAERPQKNDPEEKLAEKWRSHCSKTGHSSFQAEGLQQVNPSCSQHNSKAKIQPASTFILIATYKRKNRITFKSEGSSPRLRDVQTAACSTYRKSKQHRQFMAPSHFSSFKAQLQALYRWCFHSYSNWEFSWGPLQEAWGSAWPLLPQCPDHHWDHCCLHAPRSLHQPLVLLQLLMFLQSDTDTHTPKEIFPIMILFFHFIFVCTQLLPFASSWPSPQPVLRNSPTCCCWGRPAKLGRKKKFGILFHACIKSKWRKGSEQRK